MGLVDPQGAEIHLVTQGDVKKWQAPFKKNICFD
jgi:hypothetical protein